MEGSSVLPLFARSPSQQCGLIKAISGSSSLWTHASSDSREELALSVAVLYLRTLAAISGSSFRRDLRFRLSRRMLQLHKVLNELDEAARLNSTTYPLEHGIAVILGAAEAQLVVLTEKDPLSALALLSGTLWSDLECGALLREPKALSPLYQAVARAVEEGCEILDIAGEEMSDQERGRHLQTLAAEAHLLSELLLRSYETEI